MPRRMSVWPVAIHTRTPRLASGSSFAQNAQNPTKRLGVDVAVDAHAFPGAKLDLNDAGPRPPPAWRRARPSRRLQQGRRRRRVDLNRKQDRAVSPDRLRRARLPSPGEEQALRHACRRATRSPRSPRQRLFDDPRLLVLAPAPAAIDPQNLPIHLCVTLRLALRSHPSRPRRPQTRRPPPDGCDSTCQGYSQTVGGLQETSQEARRDRQGDHLDPRRARHRNDYRGPRRRDRFCLHLERG